MLMEINLCIYIFIWVENNDNDMEDSVLKVSKVVKIWIDNIISNDLTFEQGTSIVINITTLCYFIIKTIFIALLIT